MSSIPADRKPRQVTIDGNTAAAHVAHAVSEVIAIYPITPSSVMGEISDEKSARGEKNIWGTIPSVAEMQSEGGAAGAVHGALQAGALTTTFTASQGLLLMIPNMYKIAGELTPTVFHVSARALAAQALSIFGDHSDVMSARATGFAMLCAGSVQETMDLALVSHAATLRTRLPFIHFFDGFRTSHEIQKVESLSFDDMRSLIDDDLVREFRARSLTPDRPSIRGTAQNPDVYFQGRETCNPYYTACPGLVQETMDRFAKLTGRSYHLFDYVGAPDADRVLIMMGSGAEVAHELVDHLVAKGEKIGLLKVRLYRPFSLKHFLAALPKTTRSIAVLDRTKEPGAGGEPLYLDVQGALVEGLAEGLAPFTTMPRIIGGRYGLGSKEFTPAMVKAVYDNLARPKPRNHFVVGIVDDVEESCLSYDRNFSIEPEGTFRGLFFGLGADGTVGASKNSIKIIGQGTDNYAQGYFVYDSKKSGSMTTSHLRFGKTPIRSSYLIDGANFIACHQFVFLEKVDILAQALPGGTFLLNSHFKADEVWDRLPRHVQEELIAKKLKFFCIDAYTVAQNSGMGARINTVMQTCFFAISGILPREEAIQKIKDSIKKTYGARGDAVVEKNWAAVDQTLANLHEVKVPATVTSTLPMQDAITGNAPAFVRDVIAKIIEGKGDDVRVGQMPVDGIYPVGTSRWEKRNIALQVPVWEESLCIQCGKCAMVCPHAAIRAKAYPAEALATSKPGTFKSIDLKERDLPGHKYTIQTFVEDCTGCELCTTACPAKDKQNPEKKALNMADIVPLREQERANAEYFLEIPELDRSKVKQESVKGSQLLEPLFEFSGACAGCGETPYIKLITQLFGDRMLVANATGCSSIYGGNLPTTPYCANRDGRGPAWANSLFEDNAEFGFGMRLAVDKLTEEAQELLPQLPALREHPQLIEAILKADQSTEVGIFEQRQRIAEAKRLVEACGCDIGKRFLDVADYLAQKSVWVFGGDGWAYDIGYGGLDHVLAQSKNLNVLVMDTEVYSNTGGQMSKATPLGAVAKFAAGGKPMGKKDLGLIAMSYGHIYVASVAMGSNDLQTVRALMEAEAYDGPSLVIAYSHCIAHGIDMKSGLERQALAVKSGHWPLYRYNPALAAKGENPLKIDSKPPTLSLGEFTSGETRFQMLKKINPGNAQRFLEVASANVQKKWALLQHMAAMAPTAPKAE